MTKWRKKRFNEK